MKRLVIGLVLCGTAVMNATPQSSGGVDLPDLQWRLVGPHRAGRIWWVTGVPADSAVYYAGTPAGALWKSTSGGTTWTSISDALPVTGVGAVAVAASNANILYVGTGSNTLGNGVYRSNDAGATWQHAGLDHTKYITGLLIDPRDPDVVIAAAGSGGNFGSMVFYNNNPSAARGVYRTTDGGRTWAHTLFVNDTASVVDLATDPAMPNVIYASLSAGLYRSNDGGQTWLMLPAKGMTVNGQTIAVAPGTNARRVYAIGGGRGSSGLFRSDDSGATFALMTTKLASAGGHLYVHPKNPDVVYTMGTSVYRSIDGGKTLEAIKGAPGGDDPHSMWIDPTNPQRMVMGADQGPAITLDAGKTWTPWYTMPNGEFYFVSTDQQFPYRIYAAQQDSGTVSILSRSDFGAIRPNDWYPISGYEQGHIFADPLNARYVYSHGGGHVIIRYDRVTGQSGPVFTPAPDDRFGPRPGMDMSPKDPRWMFVGSQFVYASNDRVTWNRISPDLTMRSDRSGTGTIVSLVASPLDVNLLWAGTSNGLVHLTRDAGKTWTNVSPPRLSAEATLTLWSMEASSHDAGVAYAAAIDLSDRHGPALFMTGDFGATWKEIVGGLPLDVPTRAVREDPQLASLLYAATQRGVFVSFDRGAAWQPLQHNLPPVPVNDLTVHGDDLIAATWGRGLWALDNVSPLRQMAEARAAGGPAFLFAPTAATRVRWDNNQDTPLPPEMPQGQNPPDGIAIDYYLRNAVAGPLTIAIHDSTGALVQQFDDRSPRPDTRMPNVPAYWFKAPVSTSTAPGMHRLIWDLRYPTPPALDFGANGVESDTVSFGIIAKAVIGESPKQQPVGPLVLPGTYEVRLTAGGQTMTRQLTVVNDPRSDATAADVRLQFGYERALATGIETSRAAIAVVQDMRQAAQFAATGQTAVSAAVEVFERAAVTAINAIAGNRSLAGQLADLEFADMRPTASTIRSVTTLCARADTALGAYRQLVGSELAALNTALTGAGRPTVAAPAAMPASACGPLPAAVLPPAQGGGPAPVIVGPSAPVPPEVAIPRPTAAEVAELNAAVQRLVDSDSSSAKPLLKKFESLMQLQEPRLNVAATYTQTVQRRGPRHEGFVEVAKQGNIDLLLHGDSITDWWVQGDANRAMFDKYFGGIRTANFAISGDTTQGVLWGLKNGEGQGFQPKAVMVMIGTNNSAQFSAPEIAEGVGAVVLEMRKNFPNAKILLLAIFPRSVPGDPVRDKIAEVNRTIARLDDQQHVFYMDIGAKFLDDKGYFLPGAFRPDNLHPLALGYDIWGEAVRAKLAELLR